MEKKHVISIAGDLASGKGTVSTILAERLNYGVYRNGEYFRKLAKEMNMDITTFNKYAEEHQEIDRMVEKSAAEYAKEHDNFIIDARLGWYAVPTSFKVYLKVDIDVAANRAFNDKKRKETENFATVEEQKQDMLLRFKLENERYYEVYGVRKDDMKNYDIVIDTSNMAPEEVANEIQEQYENWLNA